MGEICIGDVRSLFKSNYVGRLTRSQVVAFQIADKAAGGPRRARRRERATHLHTELNSSIRRVPRPSTRLGSNEIRRGQIERGEGPERRFFQTRTGCLANYYQGFACYALRSRFQSVCLRGAASCEPESEEIVIYRR